MIAEDALAARCVERATAAVPGADVHAAADRHRIGLTRFANSVIHQNVADDITTLLLRIHIDGRTAEADTTVTDADDIDTLVERVAGVVRAAPLDQGWPGLAPPAELPTGVPLDRATAEATPADRAEVVRSFVDGAGGLETAGHCRTTYWTGALVNSEGQLAAHEAASCELGGIARRSGADGVARHAPMRLADLDGVVLGERAAAKANAWQDPVELPAGHYPVVLEPCAVADLLMMIGNAGYSGRAVNLGMSFVRLGEQQLDESITLVDTPLAMGYRYDHDGTPRRDLTVVDHGRSVAVAHDRRSAAEAGVDMASTGHAVAQRFESGPSMRHLGLVPGTPGAASAEVGGPIADTSVAALVADVERGVLVSEFWYTRMLETRTVALTGLTRNGVWLIEDGEVTRPVRNFRFTQSYLEALGPGRVRGIGATASTVPGDTYSATAPRFTCPALSLTSWNFTGGASG